MILNNELEYTKTVNSIAESCHWCVMEIVSSVIWWQIFAFWKKNIKFNESFCVMMNFPKEVSIIEKWFRGLAGQSGFDSKGSKKLTTCWQEMLNLHKESTFRSKKFKWTFHGSLKKLGLLFSFLYEAQISWAICFHRHTPGTFLFLFFMSLVTVPFLCHLNFSFSRTTLLVSGFDGTSNVLAGKLFGIPVRGTHAHAFVNSFTGHHELKRRVSCIMQCSPQYRGADTVVIGSSAMSTAWVQHPVTAGRVYLVWKSGNIGVVYPLWIGESH